MSCLTLLKLEMNQCKDTNICIKYNLVVSTCVHMFFTEVKRLLELDCVNYEFKTQHMSIFFSKERNVWMVCDLLGYNIFTAIEMWECMIRMPTLLKCGSAWFHGVCSNVGVKETIACFIVPCITTDWVSFLQTYYWQCLCWFKFVMCN